MSYGCAERESDYRVIFGLREETTGEHVDQSGRGEPKRVWSLRVAPTQDSRNLVWYYVLDSVYSYGLKSGSELLILYRLSQWQLPCPTDLFRF